MAEILQEFKIPKDSANDDGATVVKLYFSEQAKVKENDPIADIETTKTILTVVAECEGYISFFCKEGDELALGAPVFRIYNSPTEKEESAATNPEKKISSDVRFSCAARELVSQYNLSENLFSGLDFVTSEDVRKLMTHPEPQKVAEENPDRPAILEKIPRAKRNEIKALSKANSNGLPCTVTIECNVGSIEHISSSFGEVLRESLLPVVIYETARLLKRYKALNAYYQQDHIAYYDRVDIGVALDMGDGLVVARVPDADKKQMNGIASELTGLIEKYEEKRLTIDDLSESTFTITDLSAMNVGIFTPLINNGQSAILGIAGLDHRTGTFTLCLTFDHRVTAGREVGLFMNDLKNALESYENDDSGKKIVCCSCQNSYEERNSSENVVFLKVINSKGQEDYICQICLLMN